MSDIPAPASAPSLQLDSASLITVLNARLAEANRDVVIAETRALQAESLLSHMREENDLLRSALKGTLSASDDGQGSVGSLDDGGAPDSGSGIFDVDN